MPATSRAPDVTQVTESGDKRSPFPRRASSRAVSLATSLPQGCFLLPAQDPGLAGEMPPGCLREVPHFLGDFTDRWEDTQVPWVFPHISLFSNKARWRGRIDPLQELPSGPSTGNSCVGKLVFLLLIVVMNYMAYQNFSLPTSCRKAQESNWRY